MKKIIITVIALTMLMTTLAVSASAASIGEPPVVSLGEMSVNAIPAPADYGYDGNDVQAPAGYVDDESPVMLGTPIAAWPIWYLDEMALEKGYTISVDRASGVIRAYSIASEDGGERHIFIKENLVTACVHYGNEPGAIMALTVTFHDGLLYSSLPIEQLFDY